MLVFSRAVQQVQGSPELTPQTLPHICESKLRTHFDLLMLKNCGKNMHTWFRHTHTKETHTPTHIHTPHAHAYKRIKRYLPLELSNEMAMHGNPYSVNQTLFEKVQF